MAPFVRKFGRFLLVPVNDEKDAMSFFSTQIHEAESIKNVSTYLKKISGKYLLWVSGDKKITFKESSFRRLLETAEEKQAGLIYSDFIREEGRKNIPCPLIDYQQGSIRDDFRFGHLLIFSAFAVKSVLQKYGSLPSEDDAALYDLRLKISVDHELVHVPQFLYTVSVKNQKKKKVSGRKTEAHFVYVAKENFIRQKKMEKIATSHLKRIGAYLPMRTRKTDHEQDNLQWKASVVIPVLNRKKTIADALESVLEQKTDFPFNIIVVDNHSIDGTTQILKKYSAKHPHIHHIIPSRRDLGIGGCWNEAIFSPHCGRYIVQLDSDDLYSSPQTLQKIISALCRGRYAMVVGSYTLVNEKLKTIPPGLIDHREWTQKNGHNNLLRVNGIGAPRAFDSSVIRRTGFPNVSYGEDYSMALRISREYTIGRIYESLYLCRRWGDNTDAGISVKKQNLNDFYKDKLRTAEIQERILNCRKESLSCNGRIFAEFNGGKDLSLTALCLSLYESQKKTWPKLFEACRDLQYASIRKLSGDYNVYLQYNSARAVSSGAAVDRESVKNRPCFLCEHNLPGGQLGVLYRNKYLILCNPAPIFEKHFTVVNLRHEPQEIASSINAFLQLSAEMSPDFAVFYNGPACGASAPDHLHFQAIPRKGLPFLREYKKRSPARNNSSMRYSYGETFDRSVVVLEGKNAQDLAGQFLNLLKAAQKILKTNEEPPVNVICDYSGKNFRLFVFLRRKHRPDAYFAEGNDRIFISPGAIDMAGFVIAPLLDNYNRLDYNAVRGIFREVSLSGDVMNSILKEL